MLTSNFEQYAKYLQTRESFDPRTAKKFAEIMQEFHQGGKTALQYAQELYKKNENFVSSFLSNYGHYNQFITTNLFGDLMPMRRELRQKHFEKKKARATA